MKLPCWFVLGCALVAACGGDDDDAVDFDATPRADAGVEPDAPGAPDAAGTPDAAVPLELTAIEPDTAFYPGGRRATLTGAGFGGATTVTIGGQPCTAVEIVSGGELSCVVPPGAVGDADVAVSGGGDTATLSAGFTYLAFTRVDVVAGTGTAGFADGAGDTAQVSSAINGLMVDGATLYVADGMNYRVRTIDLSGLDISDVMPAAVTVATLAGSGVRGVADTPAMGTGADATFRQPDDLLIGGDGLFVTDTAWELGVSGALRTLALDAGATRTLDTLDGASGLASDGTYLYIAACDTTSTIQRMELSSSNVNHWVGDPLSSGDAVGDAATANFNCPYGLYLSPDGATLYLSDWLNNKLKQIDVATATTSLLAGTGTPGSDDADDGTLASFNGPAKIHGAAGHVFVADLDNCSIRQVDLNTGEVSTLAGNAASCADADGELASATFQYPSSLWYAPDYGIFVGSSDYGSRAGKPGSAQIRLVH